MTEDKLREIIRKQLDAIVENSTPIKPVVELEMPTITKTDEEISKIIEELSINEGQFSWFTSDTLAQIGSERQNTITVYMYDNKGNKWEEKKYEGYGVFGGKDYYDLVAEMNGYTDEDAGSKDLRDIGIDIAFNKKKTKTGKIGKPLFPALVENKNYNWKRHDFTKESEQDPNQSWYQEEEDEVWDYDWREDI